MPDTITTAVSQKTPPTNAIVHAAKVFLLSRKMPDIVHLVQYDQSLPYLAVELFVGDKPYTVPDGAAVNIRMAKPVPSTKKVYNPAYGISSDRHTVYIQVTTQMTAVAGCTDPVIEVVVDGGVACTGTLRLEIDANPVQENDIIDSDEYKTIAQMIADAEEAAKAAADAASQASKSSSAAASSASAAYASASTASTKAGEALASASQAGAKASEAAQSASTAATRAADAENSANLAAEKSLAAESSARAAAESEAGSKSHADNAASSASAAAASEQAAAKAAEIAQFATNEALAQAKASGEFDGKSAYQYAVEGGYTGTETEFAAKLAQEMPTTLPNPNALTFTGAATGSYDGSEPVTVEIPSSGSGGSSEETWRLIKTIEITEEVASISFDLDDDGNPFEVESLLIYAGLTVTTSGSSQFIVQMNRNNLVGSTNSFVGTTAKSIYWETHWAGLRVVVMGSTTYDFKRVANTASTVILSDVPQKITSVKLFLQNVTTFTAGKFYVYGR